MGRLDPKADSKTRKLTIHNLAFEPGDHNFEKILPELAKELVSLTRFNGAERLQIEKVSPAKVRDPLIQSLKETELEIQ